MKNIEIQLINLNTEQQNLPPKYATEGSSGLDLRACLEKKIKLKSEKTILISTGIAIYIKNPNIAGLILPRSGLGHNEGIVLGNLIGLIDSDYQGQLMISLWNRSKKDFYINPNDRVAQIIFIPIIKPSFSIVTSFTKSVRSDSGFGHSGII
ncbi:deoxyuridine 5'-triphosphate nucleotidohydrolase [Buchnera aphidicola (Diuraphis noxia)]|uniref:Deoxyuridine 5'-triphosphate nucleotidohydrolase n=1 Tax=Buchnera aphidicola subsp. Diuraphis noxia TaxID=118101 RepID=A0A1B2H9C8_BUCDN|nr:dUTP diphosphatase [Buchnera aphidicola]ANZ22738.1 deoxyuridine 5'-triphosphate nucleotidohydrolase [Buchnera aphidicola (Diuraphis noxia)]